MKRRKFLHGASLAAATLPVLGRPALAQKSAAKTLKIIHNGNLASLDLVPVMKADPNIVVSPRNPTGSYYMLQLNHTQPPFNNPKIRQALAMAVDQTQFLKSAVSDPSLAKPCYSYYGTDSPYFSEEGAAVLETNSLDKAKAALKEAGYGGEKVVILGVMESPILAAMSQVAEDLMRRMGMNVELVAMDFATMAQRRTSRDCAITRLEHLHGFISLSAIHHVPIEELYAYIRNGSDDPAMQLVETYSPRPLPMFYHK